MVQDVEAFKATLAGVARFLNAPPQPGSPEEARFAALLDELELYRCSELPPAPESPFMRLRMEAEALQRRVVDFQRHREAVRERSRFAPFPDDSQGVGPTTGV
ncbi:MAG: hypothetical protein ACK41C_08945 [Phenylobacterium sp.]|jgi:hypothetical protein|uniref:hypothetical protein n=1 Tax=Phenylobacterium sp. TaxID=1871053 RepID=UPI00391D9F22